MSRKTARRARVRAEEAARTSRIRPCAAGSIPTTGSGATPVRWPVRGPLGTSPSCSTRRRGRNHRNAIMVLVGVGAVMAVVAWVVVLLSPASEHPVESATQDTAAGGPLTTLAGVQNALPAAAAAAGHSIVELQATTTHGTVLLVGVAVAEGGLVATTADLLGGLRRIDMVGPGGKLQAASVVATDKTSDVALVSVPMDLPVATFADDSGLESGTPDMALSFVPAGGHAVALRCTDRSGDGRRDGHHQRPRLDHALDHLVPRHADAPGRRAAPGRQRRGARDPLRPRPGLLLRHLPAQRPRRGRRRRPPVPGSGRARLARGCRAPTPPTAAAPRWPRCSPADRPRASCRWASSSWPWTPPRCAPWRSCGPASTSCPRGRPSRSSVQQPAGPKVVDVTLGTSS